MAPAYDGAGSTADSSDQQLVARIRRGDDRAFEALYERYHRRIHAYVLGMVKDHGRAEDVTQEVFVSALRRMRETEQPLALKPWLYQIAKNSCIDAFRRSKRAEEVSYDADDALAPADHSRLVGSGPSPDAAVAAKQELESLCGAFGGLSETHHEILVLRELEGLSYQEIGRRMGMSRPAVESTLFRARRRLTEEYDDIVSGARCMRIQGIIEIAVSSRLGARDTRRLARHLAHCQPCRREALAAGLDRNLVARPTVRERVANKVAGLLPFPAFFKFRRGADASAAAPPSGRGTAFMSQVPMWSEQLQTGWGKAAAGGALLLAGVGAGVGVHQHQTASAASAPAAIHATPVKAATSTPTSTPTSAPARLTDEPDVKSSSPARKASSDHSQSSPHRGSGSKTSSAADRGTSDSGGSTPAPTPAASSDGGGSSGGGGSSSGGGGGGSSSSDKPSLPSPGGAGSGAATQTKETVQKTTDAVQQTTQSVTGTVRETTEQVTGAAGGAVQQVTGDGPVSDAVNDAAGNVNNTVGEVADGVDETIGHTVGAVNGILGGGG